MSEYKIGEMNIDAQNKTFKGFIKTIAYTTIALTALMLFLWIFQT